RFPRAAQQPAFQGGAAAAFQELRSSALSKAAQPPLSKNCAAARFPRTTQQPAFQERSPRPRSGRLRPYPPPMPHVVLTGVRKTYRGARRGATVTALDGLDL